MWNNQEAAMATHANPDTAQTAGEAFARYKAAFDAGILKQDAWHSRYDDGRQLACALGVLGDKIHNARDCPAQIMPHWLAQMVVWLFDAQLEAAAFSWGLKLYQQIDRLDGDIPFSVIHDWQGNVVGPLAVEVAQKRGRNVASHQRLQAMQQAAFGGDKFTADEWMPVLKESFIDAYADAYAYANANANAYAYAYADAYADADAKAYANASANAYAYADATADADAAKRLADGLVECLARVNSRG